MRAGRPSVRTGDRAVHQLFRAGVVLLDNGTDDELVARCLDGDVEAFAPLVRRYEKVMYSVALRMVGNREDARDLAQTAFLKAYEKLGTFDPRFRFFSWLYRILKNETLNFLDRQRPHQPIDLRAELPAREDPHRDAEVREESRRVQAALAQLPADHREVLMLRHYAELSYAEMADALGIPEKTVKSRLYSARQGLGERLVAGEAGRRPGDVA